MQVPLGGYSEAAKAEQQISTKVLGGERMAFTTRAKSLTTMRTVVNDHDARLAKIENNMEVLLRRPF
jgi:hypothetical protein